MTASRWLVLGIVAAVALVVGIALARPSPLPPPPQATVQRIVKLATAKVFVADVLTATGEGYRGSWLIRGDALLTIDLLRMRIETRDSAAHQVRIHLPRPTVTSPRVDHTRSQTWDIQRATWIEWIRGDKDQLRDSAMKQAQLLVEKAAASPEYMALAQTQAETAIQALYEPTGWKAEVVWE